MSRSCDSLSLRVPSARPARARGREVALAVLAMVALLAGCGPKCTIARSGEVELAETIRQVESPPATAGVEREVASQRVVRDGDRLPLKADLTFGFEYLLSRVLPGTAIEAVVEHPPVRRADGSIATGFRAPWDLGSDVISYTLGRAEERVAGHWRLALAWQGRELCAREYTIEPATTGSN